MSGNDEIWKIESEFWTGDKDQYEKHMAAECIMVFPEPNGVMKGEKISEGMKSAPRWQSVDMKKKTHGISDDTTIAIAYKATAMREGETAYIAFCSSTYRNCDGIWKLVQHQHTPAK